MTKTIRRLPNGSTTTSAKDYFKAWKKIARPIERATNSRCFSFNPGFSFYRLDTRMSTWDLDVLEATTFSQMITELEEQQKKVEKDGGQVSDS